MKNIFAYFAVMAAMGASMIAMLFELTDGDWQPYHWSLFVMVPVWIYLIKDLADRLGMSKFDKGFWLVGMALMAFGLLRFAHLKTPFGYFSLSLASPWWAT